MHRSSSVAMYSDGHSNTYYIFNKTAIKASLKFRSRHISQHLPAEFTPLWQVSTKLASQKALVNSIKSRGPVILIPKQ